MLGDFLFTQYLVKFTISSITYYLLKWVGIVKNSSSIKKDHLDLFYQMLILIFHKDGLAKVSV